MGQKFNFAGLFFKLIYYFNLKDDEQIFTSVGYTKMGRYENAFSYLKLILLIFDYLSVLNRVCLTILRNISNTFKPVEIKNELQTADSKMFHLRATPMVYSGSFKTFIEFKTIFSNAISTVKNVNGS